MLKFRNIKNSYANLKSRCFQRTEEDKYCIKMLEEALNNPDQTTYTEEEFWKIVEEMEIETYGDRNIWRGNIK